MKNPDELSPKKMVLYMDGKSLSLQKTDPTDNNELNELKELDKKGLTKVLIIDASDSFIADKGVIEKLIDDLSSSDNVISEIIGRSQQGHNLVKIYASNILLRKSELTPEQYQELVRKEDLMLEDYKKPRG